jgi:NAD(P)-dependent dehydrogenase (short-subunit alcohol dehydrogenase family)
MPELGPLLRDKVVLVTGARRGIGAAIAEASANAEADVALFATGRSDETATRIEAATGREPLVLQGDVSDAADAEEMVANTVRRFGRIDVLINNAAVLHVGGLFETSEAQFRRVIDVNLKGVFLASQAAARRMVQQGHGGVILNVGSDLAVRGADGYSAYAASKGGVLQLTRTLAIELGPHNIRVVMLSPAVTETDMAAPALREPKVREMLYAKGVLGRINRPQDVAATAVFLASSSASTVTGCNWPVDGGVLAK